MPLISLDLTAVGDTDWSEKEKLNLQKEGLFDSDEVKRRLPLEKLQHDFHYRYVCLSEQSTVEERHKITDWEAGALYRNCRREYCEEWKAKFRQRLEFPGKELIFMFGTIHRFPDQWLIIGLVYPPKPLVPSKNQIVLEFGI
jgi:hypothetical protein